MRSERAYASNEKCIAAVAKYAKMGVFYFCYHLSKIIAIVSPFVYNKRVETDHHARKSTRRHDTSLLMNAASAVNGRPRIVP